MKLAEEVAVRGNLLPIRCLSLEELLNKMVANSLMTGHLIEDLINEVKKKCKEHSSVLTVPRALLLEAVRRLILESAEFADKATEIVKEKDPVEALTDSLVYAMKYSFIPDFLVVKKEGEVRNVPAPQDVFYTFYLLDEEPDIDKVKKFFEELVRCWFEEGKKCSPEVELYEELMSFKRRVSPFAEFLFYFAPADTRPGLNLSSLLSHSLMVSALTVTKTNNPVLRLCALLHDIGKVSNPKDHAKEGAEILRQVEAVLKNVIGEDKFEELVDCVRRHHSDAPSEVREADWFASSSDRLAKLYEVDEVAKVLEEKLEEGYEKIKRTLGTEGKRPSFEARRESYEWIEKNVEKVKEATEELAKILSLPDPSLYNKLKGAIGASGTGFDAYVLVIDIGGIQRTLSDAKKLRMLSGLSYMIEVITHAYVPFRIIKTFDVKPENVVFSGGGSVQAIVGTKKDLNLGTLTSVFPYLSIRIGFGSLNNGFMKAIEEAFSNIERKKSASSAFKREFVPLEMPGLEKCEWCGTRPATVKMGNERICLECAVRYHLTSPFGFGSKSLRVKLVPTVYGRKDVIEAIGEGNYVSYVVADGNFMGLFMSLTLTPSMYQEKSLRIDLATKKSLHRLVEMMNEDDKERFVAGFLYAGGDDFNAVMSPSMAMVFAPAFTYSFSSELGFVVSSTAGVATGRLTAPIWELRDSAEVVMEEAKDFLREKSLRCLRREGACFGAFVATFSEGMMTPILSKNVYEEAYLTGPLDSKWIFKVLAELVGNSLDCDEGCLELSDDKSMNEFISKVIKNRKVVRDALKNLRKLLAKARDPVSLYYYSNRAGLNVTFLFEPPFLVSKNNKVIINFELFNIIYKHFTRGEANE